LCVKDRPDLILMDLIMPIMDGVEATRRIMADTPCAILLVTAVMDGHSAKVFEALGAGALDVTGTPVSGASKNDSGRNALLFKIEKISKVLREGDRRPVAPEPNSNVALQQKAVLAIGASAGGPAALAELLARLPRPFPASVVIVQHLDECFAQGLAEWLSLQSSWSVRVAREGDSLCNDTVLLAGSGDHLIVRDPKTIGYTPHPQEVSYRPSVDVFFKSLASNYDGHVVALLLTGMGRDGAIGLKMLRDIGHHTIAQDSTSAVFGMPKAAAALGAAAQILPLSAMANAVAEAISLKPRI
jgi:chemotaxis response regulator CheB